MALLILHLFFFFQAEDGIRDLIVTGVQTCALPISVVAQCSYALDAQRVTIGWVRDGPRPPTRIDACNKPHPTHVEGMHVNVDDRAAGLRRAGTCQGADNR